MPTASNPANKPCSIVRTIANGTEDAPDSRDYRSADQPIVLRAPERWSVLNPRGSRRSSRPNPGAKAFHDDEPLRWAGGPGAISVTRTYCPLLPGLVVPAVVYDKGPAPASETPSTIRYSSWIGWCAK